MTFKMGCKLAAGIVVLIGYTIGKYMIDTKVNTIVVEGLAEWIES